MKILLVTRCGCTRLMDVEPDFKRRRMVIPLRPDVDNMSISDMDGRTVPLPPEKNTREFVWDGRMQRLPGVNDYVYIYEEV